MQIDINLDKNSYKVYIDELSKLKFKGKVAIITNSKVGGLYLNDILSIVEADEKYVITIADGEEYKNLATIEDILEQLFVSRLDRSSTIIALGGGVISDMSGFTASIYKRGIDFITIPTTLLAQVDASVGGKTGVNNKFGKNLIGSFYQPKAVYCESRFLKSLPKREFAAGIAEAIKMAIMFDREFFEFFESCDINNQDDLTKIIKRCVELKAMVVSQDEREKGLRAVLNYGHTFAHVIENELNYKGLLHGEAVAIGMNMANRLAVNLGLLSVKEFDRIENLLIKFDLPTKYKIKDENAFYNAFSLDKKSENSVIKFILPNGIGKNLIKSDISKERVLEVLGLFK
ncbi:MAG: 3-dehydroquinate synthase [Campylobacter lanienae]|uniref:3-dehydroquinate synthase n=1 Tax=Campylobacter lanienae TaxID=75658 RepID=UPI00242DBF32|nr:3-dehydroquinate synthase [Campylobacter lanienae]MCI7363894.1 3-dehydroquinate synthase [Campylobacter lanienae]